MNNSTDAANDVAVPGLLRPPFVLLAAIILGIALNLIWPLALLPSALRLAGPFVVLVAVLLFVLSLRGFRAAGTSVRGNKRSTVIVCTGPYRFSRNPIYLAFVLFLLGLALWFRNVWLLLSAAGFASFVSVMVIPREERFLNRSFPVQYSEYKAKVRRWV